MADETEELEDGKIRKFYPASQLNPIEEGKAIVAHAKKEATEVLDFNNPDFAFIPKSSHNWRQRGYYIHCSSCDIEHGQFIGNDKIVIGLDAIGNPILKARSQVGMA